jgi:hypothetical protein
MFQCVIYRPQGELRILAQNSQVFTKLLHKMCYKMYNTLFFVN